MYFDSESRDLVSTLDSCLIKARNAFSNIESLYAELSFFEKDEDVEDTAHVVIRLEVESDQATAFAEEDIWDKWFLDNVDVRERSLIIFIVDRI